MQKTQKAVAYPTVNTFMCINCRSRDSWCVRYYFSRNNPYFPKDDYVLKKKKPPIEFILPVSTNIEILLFTLIVYAWRVCAYVHVCAGACGRLRRVSELLQLEVSIRMKHK